MTHARLHIANHDLLQGLFPQTPWEHIFSMNPFSAVLAKDCFLSSSFLFLAHLQLDSTDPVNKGYATSLYWTMPALFTTFICFSLFLRRGEKTESYPITTNQFLFSIYLYACLQIQFVIIIILFFVTVNSDFTVGGKKITVTEEKPPYAPQRQLHICPAICT